LTGRGSDGFGQVSGYRSSEINEIGCAVSVLACRSRGEPGEIRCGVPENNVSFIPKPPQF
jgi:hypothetical protein